ncbi:DUF4390 domain-containing protein [Variovorax sp. PAMC28562]|uniref:DUF4390 domain-containing protein n=1 Tax=Variovorax sp. PAMC28562 TaxID=2762323 RepID=UPI0028FC9691|nr:DUF4390 domain-containing protein [Variovorax sp. PAMC28562]
MNTTVSSTPCSKSAPAELRALAAVGLPMRRRRIVALAALLVIGTLAGVPTPALADSPQASITQMRLEEADDGIYLTAQVQFELPLGVGEVLDKGIAIYFVVDAELYRERWYWADRKVGSATRHMRLAYQPLSRRWRLNVSSVPIANAGLGVSLNQNFDSLPEALDAIKRVGRLRLADRSEVGDEATQPVQFSFRLDTTQLPRPFQIGVAGQADWNIVVERSARLALEKLK